MKTNVIKILPFVAAVLLATSCSKDDDNSAPQNLTPAVVNTVKTITITGEIGKHSLLKAKENFADQLAFKEGDEFTFQSDADANIYGSIIITDAVYRTYTATLNFPADKEDDLLAASGFKAIKGTPPSSMSEKYDNLQSAIADSYYEIPFKVTKSGEVYSLQTTASGKTGDILVFIKNAFIHAGRTGTIMFNSETKSIEIGNYYIVPNGTIMGSDKHNRTSPGCVYTVKRLSGTITGFQITSVTKSSIDEPFANTCTISGSGTVQYSSGNEKVATVDADGLVTLQGVGTTTISATVTDNDEYTYPSVEVSYTLTVNGLKNEYTVGANTKVEFALGNLLFNRKTKVYQFAEHQWDYYRNADSYGSTGFCDLLVWNEWADDESLNGWRVLTDNRPGHDTYPSEFDYLTKTRKDADKKYGWGKVNGVAGLIILPDGWPADKNPAGCNFTPRDYNNIYTVGENGTWNQMEANGAIFLPCVGYYQGSYGQEDEGFYYLSNAADTYYAYYFNFGSTGYLSGNYGSLGNKRTARLVREL